MRHSPKAASHYLKVHHGLDYATKTLANWRSDGGGPAFVKIRGRIYYDTADLDEWVQRNQSGKLAWSGQEIS